MVSTLRYHLSRTWHAFIVPCFCWLKCPRCNGGGGSPPGECPGGEFLECGSCSDWYDWAEDYSSPLDPSGRMPIWAIWRWVLVWWNGPLFEGDPLRCRFGLHRPYKIEHTTDPGMVCGDCWERIQ